MTNRKHLQKPLQEEPTGTGDDITRGDSDSLFTLVISDDVQIRSTLPSFGDPVALIGCCICCWEVQFQVEFMTNVHILLASSPDNTGPGLLSAD